MQGGPPGVPPSTGPSLNQLGPAPGQNVPVPRPPVPGYGPPPLPPSQRPLGPALGAVTASSSVVPPGMLPPPPQPDVHGGEVPGGDALQMQYFGGQLPTSGPPRVGQLPPVGPPPMSQPGMPPPNHPPVNPGPQTMMDFGYTARPESRPPNFASQGPPMNATSEMSAASQFSAHAPPQSQMTAGMSSYNYTPQPRVVQPGQAPAGPAAGAPLTGPMSQPPPRKLDPDQMPSPVSVHVLLDEKLCFVGCLVNISLTSVAVM